MRVYEVIAYVYYEGYNTEGMFSTYSAANALVKELEKHEQKGTLRTVILLFYNKHLLAYHYFFLAIVFCFICTRKTS